MTITKSEFGRTAQNELISFYRIENSFGASVTVCDYGCRIISICVPDRNGELTDVCLGYADCEQYLSDNASMGAVAGRCANRIAGGRFTLNDITYQLACNDGDNHLHGGPTGFGQRIWNTTIKDNKVIFSRISPDGEEGYPGNLKISVTYSWSEDNELSILYEATSDADTILSLTNHAYFNLNGPDSGTVLDHELRVDADSMINISKTSIPLGGIAPVDGTPFDFRHFKEIGQEIHSDHPQLAISGTYDHCLIINGLGLREAAVLQSNRSGIRMTCFTDQPGIQIYVPDSPLQQTGKNHLAYPAFSSVCLETEHFPDAIHHPEYPSVVLKTGETYKSKTIYHFGLLV